MLLLSLSCAGARPVLLHVDSRHPGCFGLLNLETGQVAFNDSSLCQERLSPASTFKIPHALIALEEGLLTPDAVVPWDGTHYANPAWAQDQTLDTAMRRSALWVFQGLARRLGREREEAWMKRLQYGNADASGDISLFWLNGPLRISPEEQLHFLARLYRGQLPVSAATQETVKRTLVQGPQTVSHVRDGIDMGGPWKGGSMLSAKTGLLTLPEVNLSWLVGHVDTKEGAFVFVSAVRSPPGASVSPHPALAAAIDALKAQGLL
ncbi:class D beta-lactamase [Comamonas sp. JC664]|uniref:class D beta-lactamase n=1 Tax=Comamonas sp. JC664 TaxID=2801917 RepID=UPI00174EC0EC|nr:class D beta-lactamase [Comamonas sp. JC664]